MFSVKWLIILLILTSVLFVVSCSGSSSRPKSVVLTEQERVALEEEWALLLPPDITLLQSYVGERDAHMKARCWLIYSKSDIVLSPDDVPSPSSYHCSNEISDTTIKVFKGMSPKTDFGIPQSSVRLRWCTGPFNFYGDLLKTSNGNYLQVQRFANKYQNMTTTSAPK
jgi:hypothetical protein